MPERKNRSIKRSQELNDLLESIMLQRGISIEDLANTDVAGHTTINRMFDLQDPKNVSRKTFARIVEALTDDDRQKSKLFRLAGLPIPILPSQPFAVKIVNIVNNFGLTPEKRKVLEEEVLAHTRMVGTLLEQAQNSQTLSASARRHLHLPKIS